MIEKKLKIDLLSDRVYRLGKTIKTADGIKLDNVENILANKLTAIVGRDEPKDVFDFHTIVSCAVFNWKEILDAAKLKCVFENDALLARLRSFPVAMLDRLSVTDSCNIEDVKTGINRAINSMIAGGLNKPWDIASSKDE